MFRRVFSCLLFNVLLSVSGLAQYSAHSPIPGYTYHPMKEDKPSWQRLAMLLGATFLVVANEGQVDIDSCIRVASRSMGVSRFSLLGEGLDDPGLAAQSSWIDKQDPATGIRSLSRVKNQRRLDQLVLLGAYYAFQPHNYYACRDSAEYFLSAAITESRQLNKPKTERLALVWLIKLYALGNDQKADSLGDLLSKLCRQSNDKDTEARSLAYRSKFTPPSASTILQKADDAQQAARLYESTGNHEGAINALTDLGYLQIILQQLPASYESFSKAMRLAESIHFPYTHYNAQALATLSIIQGKFGEPLRHIYQLLKTSEVTRDSLAWSYFYTNMSTLLDTEGRTEEAARWSQKSVTRFRAERNMAVYRVLHQLLSEMIANGQENEAYELLQKIITEVGHPATLSDQYAYHYTLSTCYLALDRLNDAEVHINKMDELESKAAAIRGPMRGWEVAFMYGHLARKRKQYSKAKQYFERSFHNPVGMATSLSSNIEALEGLLIADSALGDHAAANEHYKRYITLLDSSFHISKIRQAEELQVVYQITEKENQIASLMQQARLEKANSEKAALMRNLTIAGIIAVLIIAGLLFRQSRLRKKTNKLITQKNEQLQQLLADKEWLLKEIHHRVKNNLQIIMSLLDSQSEYISNDAALAAIEDNLRRVHAMALIHQKLYQSEDISSIAMPEYIDELVSYARESFDTGNTIRFEQQVGPLDLDVAQAIPLGLIINETIVNAIKYAFPDDRKGIVRIELTKEPGDQLVMQITDNGVGLPAGVNTKTHKSLGFDLIQGLTKQLNGTLSIESHNGLSLKIRFTMLDNLFSHKALVNF